MTRSNNAKHWNSIYSSRPAANLGWYRPHLETPLAWIDDLELDPQAAIIDVGGGASTLIDDLLASGHSNLTVLDLSAAALQATRQRLGEAAGAVTWLEGDVTRMELPRRGYRLWHDRAVFHFLIEPRDRQNYRQALVDSLAAGGYFMIGAFSPDAPPQCSGLPVQRYTADELANIFEDSFKLERQQHELHITPGGVRQAYVYCLFRKSA